MMPLETKFAYVYFVYKSKESVRNFLVKTEILNKYPAARTKLWHRTRNFEKKYKKS